MIDVARDVAAALRDQLARQAVLRQLAKAHDRFATEQQEFVAAGAWAEAEGAHQMCVLLLKAYSAEQDDPPPEFIE